MAIDAVLGNKFILLIDGTAVNCETSSSLSVTAEGITLRCKTSGEWEEFLAGGIKSGTISFEGIYVTTGSMSAFELQQKVNQVVPFVWGGTEAGDEVITGNLYINSLTIDSPLDAEVTFTGDGNISGEPTYGTVST